MTQFIKPL
jgi:hypothetical protein